MLMWFNIIGTWCNVLSRGGYPMSQKGNNILDIYYYYPTLVIPVIANIDWLKRSNLTRIVDVSYSGIVGLLAIEAEEIFLTEHHT